MNEGAPSYIAYPPPLTEYKNVVDDATLFLSTLEKLHADLGTRLM